MYSNIASKKGVIALCMALSWGFGCGSDYEKLDENADGLSGQNDNQGTDPLKDNDQNADSNCTVKCFISDIDPTSLAATIKEMKTTYNGVDAWYIRLALDPRFVDNTYGANAVGWEESKKGHHLFKELEGSDHAELKVYDGSGKLAMQFKMDYISEDGNGGYKTNGVAEKNGEMIEGDESSILGVMTSLDQNFNEFGYVDYFVDSPVTDAAYTENPEAPNWEYRVIYEVWIAAEAFGDAEFGEALVEYIHASPSKVGANTLDVHEDDCPDTSWDDGDTTGGGSDPSDTSGDDGNGSDPSDTSGDDGNGSDPSDTSGDDDSEIAPV